MFPKQVLCGGSVVFLKYYDKVFPPAYFCLRLFYIIVMDKRHQTWRVVTVLHNSGAQENRPYNFKKLGSLIHADNRKSSKGTFYHRSLGSVNIIKSL